MRAVIWGVVLVLIAGAAALADSATNEIDSYVQQQLVARHVPGMSVGVLKAGKVVLAKGYGLANVELEVAATADTVYGLMSTSKQFLAAAVLLLVNQGKLGLNDSVTKYLTDAPAAWKGVTLHHLLAHTSGIPDYTGVQGFFANMRVDATPEQLIAPVESEPLLFTPGTGWRYSNSNYYLLGMMVEKVSGMSLAAFLTERLFQPLGMSQTRLNDLRDVIANRASGYQWIGENIDRPPPMVTGYHGRKNVLQNAVYISPTRLWAAGGVVSSVNDLIKWEQALAGGKLLGTRTVEMMSQPVVLNNGKQADYGYGNELGQIKGHHFAGHQGSGVGFNAALLRLVDDHMTVIVLCNQTTAPSLPIAMHIAGMYVADLRGVVK